MRRTAWVALSATAGLLLVVGCAAAAPSRDTSAVTSASGSATDAPAPASSTPVATVDPEDPSTWLVSDRGIGPASLGTDLAVVVDGLPSGTTVDGAQCPQAAFWTTPDLPRGQLVVARSAADDAGPVDEVSWIGLDPAAWAGIGPRTAEGIGVGSAWTAVVETYPEAADEQSLTNAGTGVRVGDVWFTSRDLQLVEGIVVTAGTPAPEYCG